MIKVALALFDKPPLPMAKRAMFVFILEVLNCVTAENFFMQKPDAEKPRGDNKLRPRLAQKCAPRKEVNAVSTTTPEETCLVPAMAQEQAEKRPIAPPTPPPPPPSPPPSTPPPSTPPPSIPRPATPRSTTPCPDAPCPATPHPLTPPPPPMNARPQPRRSPWTPTTGWSRDYPVYLVSQYCRACNWKHNLGPLPYRNVELFGTEVPISCPSRGHRLYAKIAIRPADIESTRRD